MRKRCFELTKDIRRRKNTDCNIDINCGNYFEIVVKVI